MQHFKTYYKSFIVESIFKHLTDEEAISRELEPILPLLKDLDKEANQMELVHKVGTDRALKEMVKKDIVPTENVQKYSFSVNRNYFEELLKNGIIPSEVMLMNSTNYLKANKLVWVLLHYGMEVPEYIETYYSDSVDFVSLYDWFMKSAIVNKDITMLKTLNKMRTYGNDKVPANISEILKSVKQYDNWDKIE